MIRRYTNKSPSCRATSPMHALLQPRLRQSISSNRQTSKTNLPILILRTVACTSAINVTEFSRSATVQHVGGTLDRESFGKAKRNKLENISQNKKLSLNEVHK